MKCAKNAMKHVKLAQKKFVRLCQKHENCSCFTSFVFKSINFAQILENFAQTCVCTSAAYRSFASGAIIFSNAVAVKCTLSLARPLRDLYNCKAE